MIDLRVSGLGGEIPTLKDDVSRNLTTVKAGHIKARLTFLEVIKPEEEEGLEQAGDEPEIEQEDFTAFSGAHDGSAVNLNNDGAASSTGSWQEQEIPMQNPFAQYSQGFGLYPGVEASSSSGHHLNLGVSENRGP